MQKNDLITDINRVHGDSTAWWIGTGADNKRGYFPSNYVQLIKGISMLVFFNSQTWRSNDKLQKVCRSLSL
jgi:hypothetical protein